jgi:hypothetical protein
MSLSAPTLSSVEQDPQQSLFDRAIILSLTMSCLGTRRKVSTTSIETDADKALLHVSKDILDSPELAAIHHLDGSIRKYLKTRGLPSPLKHGCYLLPIDLIEPVEQRLGELFAERNTTIDAFLAAYPTKIEDARHRLGQLFDTTDYPPVDEIRAAFEASFQYLTFGAPTALQGVSSALYEREKDKAVQRIAAVEDEITQVLRYSLKELIDHMVDRLQPTSNGKPKVFRNTLISNLNEFLDTFKARNLTNDQDLEALTHQARAILADADAETLRSSADTRAHVHHQMATVKQALDALVITKPTRKFNFSNDDTA